MASAALVPFRVEVPEAVLTDLHERLDRTRWPDPSPAGPWEDGTDLDELRALCDHWRHRFDWRAVEDRLNAHEQFVTTVDGQRIHLLHARSARRDAIPLLLCHGWPGSVLEFEGVIGPLSDPEANGGSPADPAFHLVIPALPGYGFSGPTTQIGWTPRRIAGAFAEVMTRLGYTRFAAQGGDWGSMVVSQLGVQFPERVIGIHLNMVIAPKPANFDLSTLSEGERADLARMYAAGKKESGYQSIQGTRPQTLAYGLQDSPAGLAAWIVEKFRAWSGCVDDTGERRLSVSFTADQLLANITLYWVTGTIGSSVRLYREVRRAGGGSSIPDRPVPVPMGYARFPHDGFCPPRVWVEQLYDVRRWTEMPRGGHFAAMEEPDLLTGDIRALFSELGRAPVEHDRGGR